MAVEIELDALGRFYVRTEADVVQVVLQARQIAQTLGFSAVETTQLQTAVSELARNIVKYADRGEVLFSSMNAGARRGLEVVVKDRGPGIDDIAAAMSDHVSTGGTLGLGLPGVRRLVDEFEIASQTGEGTRVLIRRWKR